MEINITHKIETLNKIWDSTNIDNLKELLNSLIDNYDKISNHIDMKNWRYDLEDEEKVLDIYECNTTACIIGWSTIIMKPETVAKYYKLNECRLEQKIVRNCSGTIEKIDSPLVDYTKFSNEMFFNLGNYDLLDDTKLKLAKGHLIEAQDLTNDKMLFDRSLIWDYLFGSIWGVGEDFQLPKEQLNNAIIRIHQIITVVENARIKEDYTGLNYVTNTLINLSNNFQYNARWLMSDEFDYSMSYFLKNRPEYFLLSDNIEDYRIN